jgi:membrane protein
VQEKADTQTINYNNTRMRKRIGKKVKTARNFFEKELWEIPLKDLPARKSFFIKQLRIFIIAIQGFRDDQLLIRASALTYYTLLAVVPIVAMAFGIAKGFGLEQYMEEQLRDVFTGREEVFEYVMEFANSMLQTTQGGLVAGIGLLVLLYTIIIVMIYIEESFNHIWQIKNSRPLARKVSDYFAIIFIAPIFLILSSAAVVFLSTQLVTVTKELSFLNFISPVLVFLINLIPYVLIWIVFFLIYMVMPNTNVKAGSAIIGAVVAGTIFILTQWAYIYFQVGVSRYNAIYGSFAALPLLLFWLRISWLIVLFGVEITFANQNVEHYELGHETKNISPYTKKIFAIYIFNHIAKRFALGLTPLTSSELSLTLGIPIKIMRDILSDLQEVGLVTETLASHHKENAYQPGLDISHITIRGIIEKLDHQGMDVLIAHKSPALEELKLTMNKFNAAMTNAPENRLVKDL